MKKAFYLMVLLISPLFLCGWLGGWQSDQGVNNLGVSGQVSTFQATAPTAPSCGTNPSISSKSSDFIGAVTIGTNFTSPCKIAFANQYPSAPICFSGIQNYNKMTLDTISITTDTTALFIKSNSRSDISGAKVNWICGVNQ